MGWECRGGAHGIEIALVYWNVVCGCKRDGNCHVAHDVALTLILIGRQDV
jgi:hypothetical protein